MAKEEERHIAAVLAQAGLDGNGVQEIEPQEGHSHDVHRVRAGRHCYAVKRASGGAAFGPSALTCAREAARLGLGPPVLWSDPAGTAIVTAWIADARPADAGAVPAVVRRLRQFHDAAAALPSAIDPAGAIAGLSGGVPQDAALRRALPPQTRIEAALKVLSDACGHPVPSHGDLTPGNVLVTPGDLFLIDWDYAGMASRAWDLGYFAVETGLDPRRAPLRLAQEYGLPVTPAAVTEAMLVAATLNLLWRAATPADRARGSIPVAERLAQLAVISDVAGSAPRV